MASNPETTAGPTVMALLRELYHDADIPRWLALPQPLFHGNIPNEMIAAGRGDVLVRSLKQIVEGVYL